MADTNDNADLLALFEPFDDDWKSTTRSIRIDGTVTSVRLENFYWLVVGEIAENQGLQVPQLMTRLSKTAKSGETEHTNFTSFIRVCCGRYLDSQRVGQTEGFNVVSNAEVAGNGAAQRVNSQDRSEAVTSATATAESQDSNPTLAAGRDNVSAVRSAMDASAK